MQRPDAPAAREFAYGELGYALRLDGKVAVRYDTHAEAVAAREWYEATWPGSVLTVDDVPTTPEPPIDPHGGLSRGE